MRYLPKRLVNFLRKIFYSLPVSLRFLVRRVYYYPTDLLNSISGKRHKYEPPKGKIYTGGGDFIASGKRHLRLLSLHTQLAPNHQVLDIGSGIGRTAIALTEFLGTSASYEGFDVTKKGVSWCTKKIHRDFPNFNFTYVDISNDLYNDFSTKASNYKFPYGSDRFDIAYLFSVFTHMQPDEVLNYLKEIRRTLKPGGQCLATFFTYDAVENEKIKTNEFDKAFPFDMGNYKLMSQKVVAANVAYQKEFLYDMAQQSELKVEKVIDGFWKSAKTNQNEYQDMYIFKK